MNLGSVQHLAPEFKSAKGQGGPPSACRLALLPPPGAGRLAREWSAGWAEERAGPPPEHGGHSRGGGGGAGSREPPPAAPFLRAELAAAAFRVSAPGLGSAQCRAEGGGRRPGWAPGLGLGAREPGAARPRWGCPAASRAAGPGGRPAEAEPGGRQRSGAGAPRLSLCCGQGTGERLPARERFWSRLRGPA